MTEEADVPEITPTDLKECLDRGEAPTLVDVREPFEIAIADLPEHGQLRIPTGEFAARIDELDPNADMVIYCRTGQRSEWATRLLLGRGFTKVRNLDGGVLRWRQDVDPSLTAY